MLRSFLVVLQCKASQETWTQSFYQSLIVPGGSNRYNVSERQQHIGFLLLLYVNVAEVQVQITIVILGTIE